MAYNSKYTGAEVEALLDKIDGKQDALVSGTNIKTVNGQSLLGEGDITVGGGDVYETVIVTLTSNQTQPDEALNGAVVHVKYSDVDDTQTWQGEALTFKVPTSMTYTVEYPFVDDYTQPDDPAERIAVAGHIRQLTGTYNHITINYITLNQAITDPATMISGDVNGEVIQWIRANSHRVLGKYTADGTMTYCRLDDTNSNKYYDGTTAVLTGNEGDVFMKLPQFWYKAEETSTDVWKIGLVRDENPGNTWQEWSGNDLIGVYEAYSVNNKVYSWSGQTSTGSVPQANFKTYARDRGNGFSIVKWKHHCIMAFLFYAQYGHMNCQAKIGAGTYSYTKSTGQTNSLGMTDTTTANGNSMSINFWGLENWWGNKYEWVDNVAVNDYVWSVTEDDGTVRNAGTGCSSRSWISKTKIGEKLDLIPTAVGGSDTTGYCDFYELNPGARVVARSFYNSDTNGGVACANAAGASSYTNTNYGSRLAFSGSLVEAGSVSAYKALTAIG